MRRLLLAPLVLLGCAHGAVDGEKPGWALWTSEHGVSEPSNEERIDDSMRYEQYGPETPGADGIALAENPPPPAPDETWQRWIPADRMGGPGRFNRHVRPPSNSTGGSGPGTGTPGTGGPSVPGH